MVSTLVALGFYLCFLQCFCWLHRVVGSYLHWSSALFANVKRREWKDIQGQDHDSQPEKVDVPSPGPGQVTTPDGVVQVFWGLFHEYGESGAWDWQMDWGSINDVGSVHSFQSIRFKRLDAARHQLWKTTYCCCHLLQHLKGSHNVHSTVRCFLLISSFFMGVFPPSTFQPRWDSYFFSPVFSWYQKAVIETTGEACGDNGASARQKHKKAQGETLSN